MSYINYKVYCGTICNITSEIREVPGLLADLPDIGEYIKILSFSGLPVNLEKT